MNAIVAHQTRAAYRPTPVDAEDDEEIILLGRLFATHGLVPGIERAVQMLRALGGLDAVLAAPPTRLRQAGCGEQEIRLVGIVRQTMIRALRRRADERPVIRSLDMLLDYLHVDMANRSVEVFRVLFLNGRNLLLHDEILHIGSFRSVEVHPREIMKRALEVSAAAIILAHNHPSGDHSPSMDDIRMTQQIRQAGLPLRIAVHDHIILSRAGFTSLRATGQL